MGFFKKNIKNWTSVIQNIYEGNLLIVKHPEENFNTKSTLVVVPNEEAIFVKNGTIEQVFDSGTYNLTTENYPFIGDLRNYFSGGKNSFTASVYFIRKAHSMEIKWGTDSPVQLRDPVLKIMTSVRARGAYKVQIKDGAKFLVKLLGNNIEYLEQDSLNKYFINEFQQHIKSCLATSIVNLGKEILGINTEQNIIAQNIKPELAKILNDYGLKLVTFSIAGIDIPENDPNRQKLEEAFANKGVMNILGEDWGRQQSTEILHKVAENEGGIAGIGAAIGMGLSVGGAIGEMNKEIMKKPDSAKFCPQCKAQNTDSAKFCIECGQKFNVKRFCANCGTEIVENAKFCSNCGNKQD